MSSLFLRSSTCGRRGFITTTTNTHSSFWTGTPTTLVTLMPPSVTKGTMTVPALAVRTTMSSTRIHSNRMGGIMMMGRMNYDHLSSPLSSYGGHKLLQPGVPRSLPRSVARQHMSPQQQKRMMMSDETKKAAETVESATAETTVASSAASAAGTSSSSSSSGGGGGGGGGGFLQWYEGHLAAHPVLTKMVTGCFLWGLGDAVAQIVPAVSFGTGWPEHYDLLRTGRACFFGFALHAPTSHVHYNFLEWMTVRAGFTGLQIPLFKAFMEQFVYWSWISNSMYHGAMGAMQGMNGQQIYDRIADVLWETQKAQWVFWIPVQLVNFQYVPVRHQLNVVLLTSIVWTALLSMWYPPQDTKQSIEAKPADE